MNPRLGLLKPYPFTRLDALLANSQTNPDLELITLSIGEPKHSAPAIVLEALQSALAEVQKYPATAGKIELKQVIANWVNNRFELSENGLSANSQVLPVNGTREALFAIVQALTDPNRTKGTVGMPNPFYQIYEGAALLAGKTPIYFNSHSKSNMQPDWRQISDAEWQQMELLFICSPGNPSGTYIDLEDICYLIEQADLHDFVIVSDECYSELYLNPSHKAPSILQACKKLGRTDFSRCLAFHSLSKRSNLPGLRSGFVAGDDKLLTDFLLYRTYHGSAMPGYVQEASIQAWQDETHAEINRQLYRDKYQAVLPKLADHFEFTEPEAAFYLWLDTPIDDQEFAKRLYEEKSVKVVPGSLLARDTEEGNPGQNKIRIALVASVDECIEGIDRLLQFTSSLSSALSSTNSSPKPDA
jgi:N-succinyldiaminopimelate aminotransferase